MIKVLIKSSRDRQTPRCRKKGTQKSALYFCQLCFSMKQPPVPRKSRSPKSVRVFSTLTKTLQIFFSFGNQLLFGLLFTVCNPVFQYFRSPYRHHVVNTLLIENDVCLFLMMRARSAALSSISRGNCGIQNIFVGTVMKSEQKKKNNQDIIEMLFDVVHLVNSCMQINSSKVH